MTAVNPGDRVKSLNTGRAGTVTHVGEREGGLHGDFSVEIAIVKFDGSDMPVGIHTKFLQVIFPFREKSTGTPPMGSVDHIVETTYDWRENYG